MKRSVLLSFLVLAAGCEKPAPPAPVSEGAAPAASPAPNPAAAAPEHVAAMQKVLSAAMNAYQAGDAKALQATFAKVAPGMGNLENVERIFVQYYRTKFGGLKGVRFSPRESAPDPDRGLLVFDAAFENGYAKLSANFLRENGEMRLMQIRIEEIQEE